MSEKVLNAVQESHNRLLLIRIIQTQSHSSLPAPQRIAMPLKFTKEISTHLFKYVRSVDIKFNPFDSRTTSARELLRQVEATRFKKANPKLEIKTKILSTAEAPQALFKFIDDTELDFDSENYDCKEILHSVYMKSMQLNTQFEMDGKSVDDLV